MFISFSPMMYRKSAFCVCSTHKDFKTARELDCYGAFRLPNVPGPTSQMVLTNLRQRSEPSDPSGTRNVKYHG